MGRTEVFTSIDSGGETMFYVGVDTHSQTHTVAVLDAVGRVLTTGTYPATSAGYDEVIAHLAGLGSVGQFQVGVEGTNSYGAGLSRALQAVGYRVFEVLRPTRRVRRMDGKSDPIDAVEAARTVMSGRGVSTPKDGTGPAESLRYLTAARNKYVSVLTSLSNMILAFLSTAPASVREKYSRETTGKTLAALAACKPAMRDLASTEFHILSTMKSMAQTHKNLKAVAEQLETQMKAVMEEHYPALLAIYGVGVIAAADLAVTAGDNPQRIRSEAAFAKLCGVCPIPASSGKTSRHRLNRGGDRRGNRALHRIALVRMSTEARTRAYVEKQVGLGKSKREILRQLKRALCREIYRALTKPETIKRPVTGQELRTQRQTLGMSQAQAAQAIGTCPTRISEIETEKRPLPQLRTQYHQMLQNNQTQVTHTTLDQPKVA